MICHDLKCLFVHVPKTAGQSIERYFLDHLGLPHESRDRLLLGKNSDPKAGPPQLSHLTAAQYLSGGHIAPQDFERYFKFAFVRNPWDRLVSFYKYRGHAYRHDFKTFVFRHLPKPGWSNDACHVMPQYDYLYINGTLRVDFVGRFERIQDDFEAVCQQLGLPLQPLPHLNPAIKKYSLQSLLTTKPRKIVRNIKRMLRRGRLNRHTFGHYSQYYDAETRDYVGHLYREDIRAFDYTFDGPLTAPAHRPSSLILPKVASLAFLTSEIGEALLETWLGAGLEALC